MKKWITPGLVVLGVVIALISAHYLHEVWGGISKHTPPCAPIGEKTVPAVFAFTAFGVIVAAGAATAARRRPLLLILALLAVLTNVVCFAIWTDWIRTEKLVPYDRFCEKIGMG